MRMSSVYDSLAPKKPTNLSVNSDLLSQAKDLKINLSAVLEQALIEQVRAQKAAVWLEQNRDAIAACNEDIEQFGVFSDGLRSF
jgi:antitoxin CcdA